MSGHKYFIKSEKQWIGDGVLYSLAYNHIRVIAIKHVKQESEYAQIENNRRNPLIFDVKRYFMEQVDERQREQNAYF